MNQENNQYQPPQPHDAGQAPGNLYAPPEAQVQAAAYTGPYPGQVAGGGHSNMRTMGSVLLLNYQAIIPNILR